MIATIRMAERTGRKLSLTDSRRLIWGRRAERNVELCLDPETFRAGLSLTCNHSVSPAFIAELKAAGYDNLPAETLIRMRTHDVSAAFIKQLNEAGYKDLSADDLIYIRDLGVSAYETRRLRRAR